MLGKSFRSLAVVLVPRVNARKLAPVALAVLLAGCGGSGAKPAPAAKRVGGPGFSFRAPADWRVKKTLRSAEARNGQAIVSVTVFRLVRPYRPALWPKVVPELDRVAKDLAARVKGSVQSSATQTVAGEKARVYTIARSGEDERIAFVLRGRREYQLFCRGAGAACDELFASFRLSA
jgi:hypothetical protein